MKNNLLLKFLFIFLLLGLTFLYAQFEKNKYYNVESVSNLALKNLPTFEVKNILTNEILNSKDFTINSSLFVHIWGTWCGPCLNEFPDLLQYAEKINNLQKFKIKFLLIAVNDNEIAVRKFISKLKIPNNVVIAIDTNNSVMNLFGTLKVPESFLFNQEGIHVNKFVGPQNWMQESYITRLDNWVNPKSIQNVKIETH